jgi:hypothetical protein
MATRRNKTFLQVEKNRRQHRSDFIYGADDLLSGLAVQNPGDTRGGGRNLIQDILKRAAE